MEDEKLFRGIHALISAGIYPQEEIRSSSPLISFIEQGPLIAGQPKEYQCVMPADDIYNLQWIINPSMNIEGYKLEYLLVDSNVCIPRITNSKLNFGRFYKLFSKKSNLDPDISFVTLSSRDVLNEKRNITKILETLNL